MPKEQQRTAPRVKLTRAVLESKLCRPSPDGSQRIVWDATLAGFGVRIGKEARSFILQRDLRGGRTRRITIGRYPAWSCEKAKARARELIVQMDQGIDPAAVRRASRAKGVTVQEALDLHLERLKAKDASPRTVDTLTLEMDRYLSDWLPRPIAEVTREECRRRHARISKDHGPIAANRALRHFRALFRTAARVHELPATAPTIAIDWNKERRKRSPVLADDLPEWWRRVHTLSPVMRDYHLFVMFTGLRLTDALTVRWEHVDFKQGTIHRPKPKGGIDRAFTIPLSRFCLDLLTRRREENEVQFAAYENGDRGWAFPSVVTRGDQRVVEHLKEPKVYRDVVGADGKRERVKYLPSPHRLRDSFLSAGFAVGVPMLALKVLANHTLPEAGDVTSGYVRPDVEALRAHVEAITAWLLERMKPSGGE